MNFVFCVFKVLQCNSKTITLICIKGPDAIVMMPCYDITILVPNPFYMHIYILFDMRVHIIYTRRRSVKEADKGYGLV